MFRKNALLITIISLIFFALTLFNKAQAYIPVRTSTGAIGHWNSNQNLKIRANFSNRSGLGSSTVFDIFTTSLNRWKQASLSAFDFSYYQGSDPSKYPVFTGVTSDNAIFFTSSSNAQNQLQCGLIGVTQLYFDSNSGQMQKFDMRFNDNCYLFTNTPSSTMSGNQVYLGDVATHELGHAMGLDHSQNLQSTMIFTASIEMSHPSCDDIAGIRAAFGNNNATITGRVVASNGAPVIGAHINAISLDRGVVISSAISNSNGDYIVTGLEDGSYGIVAEAFYPGPNSLSPFYANANPYVCNGGSTRFERTFLTESGSGVTKLKAVSVGSGSTQSAGTLTVSCLAPASVNSNREQILNTAPILTQTALTDSIGATSTFSSSSTHYYRLNNQIGTISAHAISYTLFSNTDVRVDILNSSGQVLSQSSIANVFTANESGFINFDAATSITLSSMQDIIVRVTSDGAISTSRYPSGSLGVSSAPYYVLTISDGSSSNASLYANHSRCREADGFSAYPNLGDPGSLPGLQSNAQPQAELKNSSSGCGQILKKDMLDPAQNTALIFNFILMIAFALLGKAYFRAY